MAVWRSQFKFTCPPNRLPDQVLLQETPEAGPSAAAHIGTKADRDRQDLDLDAHTPAHRLIVQSIGESFFPIHNTCMEF